MRPPTTPSQGSEFHGGSALLIGDVASNGTLTWTEGHVMPSGMRASSLAIGSQAVHVATAQGVAETVEGKALVSDP